MERVAFLIGPVRIDCLLNPEAVVFRREAGLRRRTLAGRAIGESAWSDDALVCTGGGLTELQLELLFDTSLVAPPRQVDDVRLLTAPFWALAEHATDSAGHRAPHLAAFAWGKAWHLVGMVTAIAERFERFLPNGFPQRSWVRMNFVSVAEPSPSRAGISSIDIPEEATALSSMANPVGRPIDRGDGDEQARLAGMGSDHRWDQLAYEQTGSPFNWRDMVDAEQLDVAASSEAAEPDAALDQRPGEARDQAAAQGVTEAPQ